jgi:S1-C subfamily serine protease
MTDPIDQLSDALADRIAAAAPAVVAIRSGHRHSSGILWRPDVVVTSEQELPDQSTFTVLGSGETVEATFAGRDPGTNIAALRLARPLPAAPPLPAALPLPAGLPRVGSLAVVVGADASGAATGRLAMVHAVGPAWHSMAGGRIDALLRLDVRLGLDEGGPVLGAGGALLGMSTAGPRRRALVIPAETITRVLDPLLTAGRVARGWLGVSLQPVAIPDGLRSAAGRDSGMMVTSLAAGAPAEQAGVLPGDIVLEIDGKAARPRRSLASLLDPERIGTAVVLKLLRAGAVQSVSVIVAPRPVE